MLGQDAPEDPAPYSHKRCADDIKTLAGLLGAPRIILGGHDWYSPHTEQIAEISMLTVLGAPP